MTNRRWGIFFFVAVVLIFSLSFYLMYSGKETEKRLRVQKENELSNKALELTETQAQIAKLTKEKTDLVEQLNEKIATLETSLKYSEETITSQTKKMDALVETLGEENRSLEKEIQDKERKIRELTKKLELLEADKATLYAKIKSQEALKKEAVVSGETESESSSDSDRQWLSDIDTVNLGKIVVRKISGKAAVVEHVNTPYGFVVINAGTKDGLSKNSVFNILRDRKLMGKAVVQKARDHVSAAVILPEWTKGEIKEGDVISKF